MVTMHAHAPQAPLPSAKPSPAMTIPQASAAPRPRQTLLLDTYVSPVNQNGSFEFDRVIKAGYVQRRTQKTKTWKTVYIVLRPNILSIYKTDKEDKLRQKIFLSELTAVTFLRDPKHKRDHLFGLYSPSQNYYFQATSAADAQAWADALRSEARIEEEEEEMFLASPIVRRQSYGFASLFHGSRSSELSPLSVAQLNNHPEAVAERERERMVSSSPEPQMAAIPRVAPSPRPNLALQHPYNHPETSAWSGNEMGLSDYSDGDVQQHQRLPGVSSDSLAHSPPSSALPMPPVTQPRRSNTEVRNMSNVSQTSGLGNPGNIETDPDRVIWQGWLWLLRSKGGVRQWKDSWAVLRPRNLILYKDETEYAAQLILPLSSIVNVVERDPLSRTKKHCLQIITEEKSYRFSAHDEETLVHCLGAFKSLLAKRRGLEMRAAAEKAAAAGVSTSPSAPAVILSSSTPQPLPNTTTPPTPIAVTITS